jgi:lipoic acid synthetase
MKTLTYIDLGRCSYQRALKLQLDLWQRIADGEDRAFLVLVEHDPPVITLGRRSQPQHLLASRERLAEAGVELHEASRGGSVTWHGPGQLVCYPVLRLPSPGGLHGYVRGLEEAIIRVAGQYGIDATRCQGATGVWVGREKLAAIGVAVKRWVAYHGFAMNVCPEMRGFDMIVPCGLADRGVTSLSKLLGRPITVEEVKPKILQAFAEVMGFGSVRDAGVSPACVADILSASGVSPMTQTQRRQQQDAGGTTARHEGETPSPRLPVWFRRRMPDVRETAKVRGLLSELGLATVCGGAKCPNIGECFACGTATFMILGEVCTRDCRFCAVPPGKPLPPREDEPDAVAQACKRLALRHAVITCVTRDDLPDGGAEHFAKTVRAVRRELPRTTIEVLTSDLGGDASAIHTVLQAGVDVFNHNIETTPRLYPLVRPARKMGTGSAPFAVPVPFFHANYRRSLQVLARASQWALEGGMAAPFAAMSGGTPKSSWGCLGGGEHPGHPQAVLRVPRIKSGIMVGLGETHQEVLDVLADLRAVGCQLLTVGQYLAPSRQHVPVARFVPPDEFEQFRREALAMGFQAVASGPLVRSSYHAEKMIPSKPGQGLGRA